MTEPKRLGNRLAHETSPYLLQHAENPVDWYPWGDEAFALARESGRPVLLSIGYSACHWCHVMERESFEDPATAALMNERFVNVKVDREERPDVDHVYMQAVQMLTGSGGWPLTVFLKPDGEPFYGGTYFPPERRHGMPAFREILEAAADAWSLRRDKVDQTSAELRRMIAQASVRSGAPGSDRTLDPTTMDNAARKIAASWDATHGGFGGAPKFPQPMVLEFLLGHHWHTGEPPSLSIAVHTLRRMAAGGMRDQLGGGFHRYSVDARWLVPHFEKMLYDNALLARVYTQAFQLTGSSDLADVAESTLDYVLSDLADPAGGFRSARDADSDGEEGLFYVWTAAEVDEVLGEDAPLFRRAYDVSKAGNFEGRNILHGPHDADVLARSEGLTPGQLAARLERSRIRLLEVRAERTEPFLDDKVLASWCSHTIRALAAAAGALGRPDYLGAARRATEFLLGPMSPDGRLMHSFRGGAVGVPALLQDVAGLGNALLDLYVADPDPRWVDEATRLAERILDSYLDDESGLLYDTPHDGEQLIVRPRALQDGAEPSGNALAAELLLRVGHLSGRERFTRAGSRVLHSVPRAGEVPLAFPRTLSVTESLLEDSLEVVILGEHSDPRWKALHREVTKRYLPGLVFLSYDGPIGDGDAGTGLVDSPLLVGKTTVSEAPTAYVCWHHTCSPPVTDASALGQRLDQVNGGPVAAPDGPR